MIAPLGSGAAGVTQELLDECSQEPIHIPGAIQAHGTLLSVGIADLVVRQVAANAAEWLGIAAGTLLGQVLDRSMPEVAGALRTALAGMPLGSPTVIAARAGASGRGTLQITALRQGDVAILECEPSDPDTLAAHESTAMIARTVPLISAAVDIAGAARAATRAVHALTGYDRVMVYRFDADGHGEVIAETTSPGAECFIGLCYPASDIPQQARAMMLTTRVRMIADSAQRQWPLLPREDPISRMPLDLSRSQLRAVSPIHLEYLRNMRVGGSLTAAIVVDGALWGLVACQHGAPRGARHAMRAHLDLIGDLLAARITEFSLQRQLRALASASRLQNELLDEFSLDDTQDWANHLMRPDRVLALVGATGALLSYRGSVLTAGLVPPQRILEDIRAWLAQRMVDDVVAIDRLPAELPSTAGCADTASGCLAVRLDPGGSDLLLWFRPEQVHTVNWGGDPRKPVARAADGLRLTPRASFAQWSEEVRGRSRAWTVEDIAAAQAMRTHLQRVVHRVYEVKRVLARSNEDLGQFAYAAAHDLQEPLRTVATSCDFLAKHLGEFTAAHGLTLPEGPARFLGMARESAARGKLLIEDLLAYARLDHEDRDQDQVALAEVVDLALAQLDEASGAAAARITTADLPTVVGNRRQLTQLMQNLLGNALKYRGVEPVRIAITAVRRPGAWEIAIADNGIGIDPAHHEQVFETFRRLHGAGRYPGTGVGLALCRKIVRRHGGRIWVESAGAGRGATFRCTLSDEADARRWPARSAICVQAGDHGRGFPLSSRWLGSDRPDPHAHGEAALSQAYWGTLRCAAPPPPTHSSVGARPGHGQASGGGPCSAA
ncbi:MAG: GAF domain-containing protein [Planctomycetes bacterium]|nr:GAF domain-containing protein [Planctomycetota bacterium]